MRGKKDWLLVYPSIEYVVECVLEHKPRRSGHIKKSISFLDCRVKHLEDRPQCCFLGIDKGYFTIVP